MAGVSAAKPGGVGTAAGVCGASARRPGRGRRSRTRCEGGGPGGGGGEGGGPGGGGGWLTGGILHMGAFCGSCVGGWTGMALYGNKAALGGSRGSLVGGPVGGRAALAVGGGLAVGSCSAGRWGRSGGNEAARPARCVINGLSDGGIVGMDCHVCGGESSGCGHGSQGVLWLKTAST